VVVEDIYFHLLISATSTDPPRGFLFLCPETDFQTGQSLFRGPQCPAYWSLDPSGVEHLSVDDATALGFPTISLSTEVYGLSWDASVYAALRQFHQAKGFDPESQDVAHHRGAKLYQLSSELVAQFAHSESTMATKIVQVD
jgi:hypothetical protein